MLRVCHLYPELLNLYGDRGNIIAFVRRCQWRGIPVKVDEVTVGQPVDFFEYDFLFLGGGSDREQGIIAADLARRREELQVAIEKGLVVLAICGGYQLLGRFYLTPGGREIPGLALLDFYTEGGKERMIGNVAVEIVLNGKKFKMCGFENHAGRTYLGNCKPLARVLKGYGNNGEDGYEGAQYKNVFCTYLHGPLLPKNPVFTDHLIYLCLRRRKLNLCLGPLDDRMEDRAREVMLKRLGV